MFEAITARDDFTKKSGTGSFAFLLALSGRGPASGISGENPLRLRPLAGVINQDACRRLERRGVSSPWPPAIITKGLESHDDARIAGVAETNEVRPAAFLRYELQPNLKHPYPAGMQHHE